MSKHTPGPWSASAASSIVGAMISAPKGNIGAAFSQIDKAECEANASLIAAAPELLEELRQDCVMCERFLNDEAFIHVHHIFQYKLEKNRAVIAKAEGVK